MTEENGQHRTPRSSKQCVRKRTSCTHFGVNRTRKGYEYQSPIDTREEIDPNLCIPIKYDSAHRNRNHLLAVVGGNKRLCLSLFRCFTTFSDVPCTYKLMNNYRLGFCGSALAVAVFFWLGSPTALAQRVPSTALANKNCSGLHCAFVRIDDVTTWGKGLKYITASGSAGTYILSCLTFENCQIPVQAELYEYSEQPLTEPDDDRYAFLTGPKVEHEQYTLEVIVPLPVAEVRRLIGQCQGSDQFATEADCGKWITRKLAIERTACPDPEAVTACKSFEELVHANDRDVMNDLANQDHVYACFLPDKDEFFEVTFSEPTWFSFAPPDGEQVKEGVPRNALTIRGGSEFAYYKDGVGDENRSLHNIGNWIYFPLGDKTDLQSMRKNATSKRAQFKGKNIEIDGDRWTLSETYKNQAGTETTLTVTVQLATGRFKEDFILTGTGQNMEENSGRCLIVPSNYF